MLLTPAYRLTVAGKVVDTTQAPQASTVVELLVALSMEVPVDSFTLVLGQVGGLKPAVADSATVELGYADDGSLTKVMTGSVVAVDPDLLTRHVTGYGAASLVLATFVEHTFEGKTAGEIVRDLAGRAGVKVASADDGITFPAYVVDGRRSAYVHIHDLAELSGLDFYLNPDGELVFEAFTGGKTVHVFDYAKDILALEVTRTPPRAGLVEAWGESPTGSQGEDAWPWLTKDFSGSLGTAGSGARLLLERPALRTSAAARTAANSALTEIQRRTLRGELTALGRPQVSLGDAIRLRSVPDDSLNTDFQVRSVTHRMLKTRGFTTTIGFRAIGGKGAAA